MKKNHNLQIYHIMKQNEAFIPFYLFVINQLTTVAWRKNNIVLIHNNDHILKHKMKIFMYNMTVTVYVSACSSDKFCIPTYNPFYC